jgi:hypothetical protein
VDETSVIKYVPDGAGHRAGWLVYGRDGALLAQPFDANQLELNGEPFSVSEKVGNDLVSFCHTIFRSLTTEYWFLIRASTGSGVNTAGWIAVAGRPSPWM